MAYKDIAQHRVFKNTSALLIMQVFTYIAPFLVLPYLSRVLGADGFGLMVVALSLTIFSNIITDYGFNLSATYLISRKKNHKDYISQVISAIYTLKIVLLFFVFVALAVYLYFSSDYTEIAIFSIYSTVLFQSFISPWLFQGIEKMKLITYSTIVSRIFYVGLIFLFVNDSKDYDVALICHAAATFIYFLLSNIFVLKEGFYLVKPSKRLLRFSFLYSNQFFISRLTLSASSSLSMLVLAGFVTPAQMGLFGASEKLFNAFKQLIYPFSQALYPYMASTGNSRLLIRLVSVVSAVMLIPAIVGYLYAEQFLEIIFGNEFVSSYDVLRVFIITGYLAFISICFGYPAFASIKRIDLANKSVIVSGGFQLLFLFLLYFYGYVTPLTIAYSILITELLTLYLRLVWFFKISKEKN